MSCKGEGEKTSLRLFQIWISIFTARSCDASVIICPHHSEHFAIITVISWPRFICILFYCKAVGSKMNTHSASPFEAWQRVYTILHTSLLQTKTYFSLTVVRAQSVIDWGTPPPPSTTVSESLAALCLDIFSFLHSFLAEEVFEFELSVNILNVQYRRKGKITSMVILWNIYQ